MFFTETPRDGQTIFIGQAEVKQNEVARVLCECVVDLMAVTFKDDLKALAAQEESEIVTVFDVVCEWRWNREPGGKVR